MLAVRRHAERGQAAELAIGRRQFEAAAEHRAGRSGVARDRAAETSRSSWLHFDRVRFDRLRLDRLRLDRDRTVVAAGRGGRRRREHQRCRHGRGRGNGAGYRAAGRRAGAARCRGAVTSAAAAPGAAPARRGRLVEQLGQLLDHDAAEFLGVDDRHRAAVIARHVVADADGDQLDRRALLDLLDDPAQMPLEIIAGIDRERRIVDRRAVGDHHQDLALLGARQQALVGPVQRLAVDVLLEQALAHHQAEIAPRAPPRRVGGLVDDVAQVVEAAGIARLVRRRARPRATARPSTPAW